MNIEQTQDDKQRIQCSVIAQMKEYTGPSISQICGAFSLNSGEPVGSGTIVKIGDKSYFLTANHVVDKRNEITSSGGQKYPEGLCHTMGSGELMLRTGPLWYTWPTPQDIAASPIESVELSNSTIIPLRSSSFALDTNNLDYDDLYFVHGWPAQASHFSSFAGPGFVSRSQPYGGWHSGAISWHGFDETIHIAITYPMSEIIDERGKPTNLIWPAGISGSLLWKTNHIGHAVEWTPHRATVVGLVHRFDQEKQCLIATRIEYVKGLLLTMLRDEFAYFRWLNRGQPIGDDWQDWFAAEQKIVNL